MLNARCWMLDAKCWMLDVMLAAVRRSFKRRIIASAECRVQARQGVVAVLSRLTAAAALMLISVTQD